jgi:uracil-DNA glycosylase family 4
VSSAVRCAPPDNKPSTEERDACRTYLVRERELLTKVRVVVCLGNFAYEAVCKEWGVRPRPKFGHGVEATASDGITIICSYHPSQQNTFTGKLTEPMLDAVFTRARKLSK